MAYKKYIKRDGKLYGPYIYHSRKVNGKVISEYLGKGKEKNKNKRKKILSVLIIALIIFSLIIALNYNKIDFSQGFKTTKSILNNLITPITKSLTGFAIFGDSEDIEIYPKIVNGKIGKAYQFDGVDDYIDARNDPSLNFGAGDFTVETWFKLSSHPTDSWYGYPIVQKTDASYNNGWWLWVHNHSDFNYETKLGFAIYGGAVMQAEGRGNTKLELDTWYHAVGVKGTDYAELYLNGIMEKNYTNPSVNSDSSENLLIGTWIDFGSYFNGTIDNVRIFNRSLSADEVIALYEQRLATQETQDIFDLKIVEGVKE